MKRLLWFAGGLAIVVAIVAGAGAALPVGHEASRSAILKGTVEDVYVLVSNVKDYPTWWPDVTRVDILVEAADRTTFREHLSTGPVIMSVVESSPPSRFVTKIDDPDQPFGGTWTFEITPSRSSGGTQLTITERGEIYNPIFRFLAHYVFGYTGTMESFLKAAQGKMQG
jgi:ribosome-associated toxin RatA of RatAB toxin-antitoxin module